MVALFEWIFFFFVFFLPSIFVCATSIDGIQKQPWPWIDVILFQSILDSTLIKTCNIAQNASLNGNGPPIQPLQSTPFSVNTEVHLCNGLDAFWVRTFPHKNHSRLQPLLGQLVTLIISHAKGTELLPDFGTLHRPTYPFKMVGHKQKTISRFHPGCLLAEL